MADGISNIFGERTATWTMNGQDFVLSVAVLADHAEKELFIASQRPTLADLLTGIPDALPLKEKQALQKMAMEQASKSRMVTLDEEQEFDSSLTGTAWRIWRALRDHNAMFGKCGPNDEAVYVAPSGKKYTVKPDAGIDLALRFMEEIGNRKTTDLLDAVEGSEEKDILGKSDGSMKGHPESPENTTASRGPESSDSLPSNMAGQTETSAA